MQVLRLALKTQRADLADLEDPIELDHVHRLDLRQRVPTRRAQALQCLGSVGVQIAQKSKRVHSDASANRGDRGPAATP